MGFHTLWFLGTSSIILGTFLHVVGPTELIWFRLDASFSSRPPRVASRFFPYVAEFCKGLYLGKILLGTDALGPQGNPHTANINGVPLRTKNCNRLFYLCCLIISSTHFTDEFNWNPGQLSNLVKIRHLALDKTWVSKMNNLGDSGSVFSDWVKWKVEKNHPYYLDKYNAVHHLKKTKNKPRVKLVFNPGPSETKASIFYVIVLSFP